MLDKGPTFADNQEMPSRNIVKEYVEGGYYHIYNRGVEKRLIFLDQQDCNMFLYYIELYLSPLKELEMLVEDQKQVKRFLKQNLSSQVTLLAYALMPNHFHFAIKQQTKDGIIKFMRRLTTAYVMYFNNKYKRVGSLFQNKYKACRIDKDAYLLELSRYIHQNPLALFSTIHFQEYSSLGYYYGLKYASWIQPEEVLSYFKTRKDSAGLATYKEFIEEFDETTMQKLEGLTLEDDR